MAFLKQNLYSDTKWYSNSDADARKVGKSKIHINKQASSILFSYSLESLKGKSGPVGFVMAYRKFKPFLSSNIKAHLKSPIPIHLFLFVKTHQSYHQHKLNFYFPITLSENKKQTFLCDLRDFQPYFRGKDLCNHNTDKLKKQNISAVGFAIWRSQNLSLYGQNKIQSTLEIFK